MPKRLRSVTSADVCRRDKCHLLSKRGLKLDPDQSAGAWKALALELDELAHMEADFPKFHHLIEAIRRATIAGANGAIVQFHVKRSEWDAMPSKTKRALATMVNAASKAHAEGKLKPLEKL